MSRPEGRVHTVAGPSAPLEAVKTGCSASGLYFVLSGLYFVLSGLYSVLSGLYSVQDGRPWSAVSKSAKINLVLADSD